MKYEGSIFDLITMHANSTFYRILRFPQNICDGCGKPAGDAYLPDTWFHPFFGACICSDCRPVFKDLQFDDLETELDHRITRGFQCDECGKPAGSAYSSEHLVPSHLGLAYVLLVESNPVSRTCRHFSGLFTSNIPLYFLDFVLYLFESYGQGWSFCPHSLRRRRFYGYDISSPDIHPSSLKIKTSSHN